MLAFTTFLPEDLSQKKNIDETFFPWHTFNKRGSSTFKVSRLRKGSTR